MCVCKTCEVGTGSCTLRIASCLLSRSWHRRWTILASNSCRQLCLSECTGMYRDTSAQRHWGGGATSLVVKVSRIGSLSLSLIPVDKESCRPFWGLGSRIAFALWLHSLSLSYMIPVVFCATWRSWMNPVPTPFGALKGSPSPCSGGKPKDETNPPPQPPLLPDPTHFVVLLFCDQCSLEAPLETKHAVVAGSHGGKSPGFFEGVNSWVWIVVCVRTQCSTFHGPLHHLLSFANLPFC